MQSLQTLINHLLYRRNIHISILDFIGILNTQNTQIEFKNIIHSKQFCCIAKSTEQGYRTCLSCKKRANDKALSCKTPFGGKCFYGLYEAATPVILENNVAAIVYVGNAIVDERQTKLRLERTCESTGVSAQMLLAQMEQCEYLNSPDELFQIGEIVADYLKLLYKNNQMIKSEIHWLVTLMKRYADERYCYNISLKEFSVNHQKNEKYLGRLFKKEMGKSFSEYCTELRLRKAEDLLSQSDDKIINIAFESGFNNISYFNRVFQKNYGMSPTKYRKKYKKM